MFCETMSANGLTGISASATTLQKYGSASNIRPFRKKMESEEVRETEKDPPIEAPMEKAEIGHGWSHSFSLAGQQLRNGLDTFLCEK